MCKMEKVSNSDLIEIYKLVSDYLNSLTKEKDSYQKDGYGDGEGE